MSKLEILEELRTLREVLLRDFKAEIKGIFGSYARDEQTAASDLDVLVEFKPGATLLDLVNVSDFLEEQLNMDVDVVSQRAVRQELKDSIYGELVTL